MRAIAQIYHKRGYHVMSVLLPGHGSIPGELLRTSHTHWYDAVDYGYNELAKRVDNVHIFGYSTGGLLAALKVLDEPKICSVGLGAPAFGITRSAVALPWVRRLTQWMPYHWPARSRLTSPHRYVLSTAYDVTRL